MNKQMTGYVFENPTRVEIVRFALVRNKSTAETYALKIAVTSGGKVDLLQYFPFLSMGIFAMWTAPAGVSPSAFARDLTLDDQKALKDWSTGVPGVVILHAGELIFNCRYEVTEVLAKIKEDEIRSGWQYPVMRDEDIKLPPRQGVLLPEGDRAEFISDVFATDEEIAAALARV